MEKKEFHRPAGFFKGTDKTAVLKAHQKEESHDEKVLRHITALLLSTHSAQDYTDTH